jgi:hypothetical protein
MHTHRVLNKTISEVMGLRTKQDISDRITQYFTSKKDQSLPYLNEKAKLLEAKLPQASSVHIEGYEDARVRVGLAPSLPPRYEQAVPAPAVPATPTARPSEKAGYSPSPAPASNPFLGPGEGSSAAAAAMVRPNTGSSYGRPQRASTIATNSTVASLGVDDEGTPKIRQLSAVKRAETLEKLYNRQYTVAIDRSSSMGISDVPASLGSDQMVTRWMAVSERTVGLSDQCDKYDPDGIELVSFGTDVRWHGNANADGIEQIFEKKEICPDGLTNMVDLFKGYHRNVLRKLREGERQHTLVVIGDGAPQDKEGVRAAIKAFAIDMMHRGLSDEDIAISVLLIGNGRDAQKAWEFWVEVDDELKNDPELRGYNHGQGYDIVDKKQWNFIVQHGLSDEEILAEAILD